MAALLSLKTSISLAKCAPCQVAKHQAHAQARHRSQRDRAARPHRWCWWLPAELGTRTKVPAESPTRGLSCEFQLDMDLASRGGAYAAGAVAVPARSGVPMFNAISAASNRAEWPAAFKRPVVISSSRARDRRHAHRAEHRTIGPLAMPARTIGRSTAAYRVECRSRRALSTARDSSVGTNAGPPSRPGWQTRVGESRSPQDDRTTDRSYSSDRA
jgi:hypothetical protein